MPPRSKVFLDLQCAQESWGRISLELFDDKTPRTCQNFRAICTSSHVPRSGKIPLTYEGAPFHRVIDGFMVQGGDITAGDGTGGASIYGGNFEDENIEWRKIDKKGLLCMANRGKNTNSSQFFITLAPCEHLNAKHTIFGHLVSGQEVLDRMAKVPVDRKDRPLSDITIARCGELDARPKPTEPTKTTPRTKNPVHSHSPSGPSRGREAAKRSSALSSSSRTHSDSRSRSVSPHGDSDQRRHHPDHQRHHHHHRHHHKKPRTRRRSDVAIDETRRGRSLTRSPSPETQSSRTLTRAQHQHQHHHAPPQHGSHRKRSPPPSRPHSRPRSRSPHLRRRRTRSRSRRDRDRVGDRRGDQDVLRRSDEDALREVEEEREGGRAWPGDDGVMMEGVERHDERRRDTYQGSSGYRRNRSGRGWDEREVRGGGGGGGGGGVGYDDDDDDGGGGGEPAVQFKGRGSMKYRERK